MIRTLLLSATFLVASCQADIAEDVSTTTPQAPAPSVEFAQEEQTATGPTGTLGGIMTRPETPATDTVVLVIPGSGPTDRDGNNPQGMSPGSYRMLSNALAERGVASLRIDKRGMFSSAGGGDANDVTLAAYGEDIAAWTRTLDAECIVLAGHSEGGLVALQAANTHKVCGLVLLTTPGRPMGDILREQLRANPANRLVLGDANRIIEALEAGKRVPDEDIRLPLRPLFRADVQDFLIDLMAFDPVAKAEAADVPILLVGGSEDIQVTRADYDALAPHADETLWVDGMSHVLKTVEGKGRRANMKTYTDPDLPLVTEVAEAVAEFAIGADAP